MLLRYTQNKICAAVFYLVLTFIFTVEQVSLSSTPAPAVTPSSSAVASVVSQEMTPGNVLSPRGLRIEQVSCII
jgi:hypothetical protein